MNLQKELENLLQKDQAKKENILTSQRTQELFQDFEKNHNQEAQQFKQKLEKSVENQKQVNNLMTEAIKKQVESLSNQEEIIADYQNFISRVIQEGGKMERYYKELLAQAYAQLKLSEEKLKKQANQFSQAKTKF